VTEMCLPKRGKSTGIHLEFIGVSFGIHCQVL
jgi:hypothetical protein